ncbi:hypothetical protein KKC00_03175 [Patescibacteria group bacterium]|nr:hypothetical protein [Patescibacteria group bacterium]
MLYYWKYRERSLVCPLTVRWKERIRHGKDQEQDFSKINVHNNDSFHTSRTIHDIESSSCPYPRFGLENLLFWWPVLYQCGLGHQNYGQFLATASTEHESPSSGTVKIKGAAADKAPRTHCVFGVVYLF